MAVKEASTLSKVVRKALIHAASLLKGSFTHSEPAIKAYWRI